MNKINIAVIGTGRMGGVHVRNLVRKIPEANLVAICDIRLEVAQALADELGIARVVRDYHELLDDPSIPAVLIATSTDTHAMIVIDAARAGKHIFCEKPLALDLPSIDAALAAVDAAGVKLQVGFNRRFDAAFRRVRELVASGEIGRPCILRIASRDPEPPPAEYAKVSGGMFLDMTIHDFDMARFQVGEVEEVYAMGGVLVAPWLAEAGDIDTDIVTLRFANGALGVIDNSRQAVYGYDQRLEVLLLGRHSDGGERHREYRRERSEGWLSFGQAAVLLPAPVCRVLCGGSERVPDLRPRRQAYADDRPRWPPVGCAGLRGVEVIPGEPSCTRQRDRVGDRKKV